MRARLGLSRAPDGASWITLTSRFERAVRDLRLALGAAGLATRIAHSARPDRAPERTDVRRSKMSTMLAPSSRARAGDQSGRDAELDLLIARVAGLRKALAGWSRAVAAAVGGDAEDEFADGASESAPSVRWISVSTHGAQFNQTPLATGPGAGAGAGSAAADLDFDVSHADRGRDGSITTWRKLASKAQPRRAGAVRSTSHNRRCSTFHRRFRRRMTPDLHTRSPKQRGR